MITDLSLISTHNKYSTISSSGLGEQSSTRTIEEYTIDLTYTEEQDKPPSLYAGSLIKRVSMSNYLSDGEKKNLISLVASFDEGNQLQDASIYTMVSITIQMSERANARDGFLNDTMEYSKARQEYDNTRKLFKDSPDQVEISARLLVDKLLEDSFGKKIEEVYSEFNLEYEKNGERFESSGYYNSKGQLLS